MLTCLQKHEYDNFACDKEVADFYTCVNEFQVGNHVQWCSLYSTCVLFRTPVRRKRPIWKAVVIPIKWWSNSLEIVNRLGCRINFWKPTPPHLPWNKCTSLFFLVHVCPSFQRYKIHPNTCHSHWCREELNKKMSLTRSIDPSGDERVNLQYPSHLLLLQNNSWFFPFLVLTYTGWGSITVRVFISGKHFSLRALSRPFFLYTCHAKGKTRKSTACRLNLLRFLLLLFHSQTHICRFDSISFLVVHSRSRVIRWSTHTWTSTDENVSDVEASRAWRRKIHGWMIFHLLIIDVTTQSNVRVSKSSQNSLAKRGGKKTKEAGSVSMYNIWSVLHFCSVQIG